MSFKCLEDSALYVNFFNQYITDVACRCLHNKSVLLPSDVFLEKNVLIKYIVAVNLH